MTTKVKICGVRNEEALEALVEAGADFAGFVFYPPSPRSLSLSTARSLADQARGLVATVAVLVDADDALISDIVNEVRPDMLQLHGSETAERCADIRTLSGKPIIKAVPVSSAEDVWAAERYRNAADLILFDAKAPVGAHLLPGGNGVPFDWTVLSGRRSDPFILSGGLSAETVGVAIATTRAAFVDVSSGVESAPGVKDAGLIRAFVRAAKAAALEKAPA